MHVKLQPVFDYCEQVVRKNVIPDFRFVFWEQVNHESKAARLLHAHLDHRMPEEELGQTATGVIHPIFVTSLAESAANVTYHLSTEQLRQLRDMAYARLQKERHNLNLQIHRFLRLKKQTSNDDTESRDAMTAQFGHLRDAHVRLVTYDILDRMFDSLMNGNRRRLILDIDLND